MGETSYLQTNFQGGEWSQTYQGRMDDPHYRTALAICLNAFPTETGAWTRRGGSRFLATTRGAVNGRVIKFDINETLPYVMEFTNSFLRFYGFNGNVVSLITTNDAQTVTAISTANPTVVTTALVHGWTTGNTVMFSGLGSTMVVLQNRQFLITVTGTKTFSLQDAITGANISGAAFGSFMGGTVARVMELPTSYVGSQWQNIVPIQTETQSILVNGQSPQVVSLVTPPTSNANATFSLAAVNFVDGPYLDPIPDSVVNYDNTSGAVTLTFGFSEWFSNVAYALNSYISDIGTGQAYKSLRDNNINHAPSTSPTFWVAVNSLDPLNPNGFTSGDLGRHIRLFSEPVPFNISTTYGVGAVVSYPGGGEMGTTYWLSLVAGNVGTTPGTSITNWALVTGAAYAEWTWGKIISVSSTGCTIELIGPELLYSGGTPIFTWQAGVYSNTTGWPTCGCYYEGRLWLAGAVANRIDSSMSNNLFTFSPTGPDGTVADDNGISFTFNADGTNTIYWMEQDALGIVCGTDGGEWLVPNAAPPLTPSNISAARVTKQNCANIQPVRTEHTICAVQRMQRKMFEYFADIFSGKFTAPNITERARHLTASLIEEIRYQQELTPTIWARMGDGSLNGCSYKRDTLMTSQGPTYYGWHRHQFGSGRQIVSLTVGPTDSGGFDSPIMVTLDPLTNLYHVELLTDYFEEASNYQQAFLLDDAVVPASYSIDNMQTHMTVNGLWHLNGKTVQVFAAGLDCGLQNNTGTISDFTVSNGSVVVPFGDGIAAGSGAGLFTAAFVNSFAAGAMPIVVGFTYTSQGQLLRPVAPAEVGTRQGPGFGKKRRNHRFAVQTVQTNALSVGTNLTQLQPVPFRPINGAVPVLLPNLFSGVFQDEIRDDFTYDGQICWQISRPVPALIAAIGGFIDTADI